MLGGRLGPIVDDNHRQEEASQGVEPPEFGVEADLNVSHQSILGLMGAPGHKYLPIGKAMEPTLNITSEESVSWATWA